MSVNETITNVNSVTRTTTDIMTGYDRNTTVDWTAFYSTSRDDHSWIQGNSSTSLDHDTSVRMTLYRYGGHNVWVQSYENPDVWKWLWTWSNTGVIAPTPTPVTVLPTPTPTPSPTPVLPNGVAFDFGSVLVDFGSSGTSASGMNSMDESKISGGSIPLTSVSGQKLTANLKVSRPFGGVNQSGTTSPAGWLGFSSEATRDSFYGNDVIFNGGIAPSAQLVLSNLNPAKNYSFEFFASRMGVNGENRETQYTVGGATTISVYLNVAENTMNVASVGGLRPRSDGTITIDIKKGPNNTNAYGFYYIGVLRVSVVDSVNSPTPTPLPPSPTPTALPTPTPSAFTSGTLVIDIGDGGVTSGLNRVPTSLVRGGSFGSLVNSTGLLTPARLDFTGPFNGVNYNGTSSPAAPGFSSEMSHDSFYGSNANWNGFSATEARVVLSGLSPTKSYRFELFASRMGVNGENRETEYRAQGANSVVDYLNVSENTSKVAVLNSVLPDSSGSIVIIVRKGPNNTNAYGFFYLGSMRVTAE